MWTKSLPSWFVGMLETALNMWCGKFYLWKLLPREARREFFSHIPRVFPLTQSVRGGAFYRNDSTLMHDANCQRNRNWLRHLVMRPKCRHSHLWTDSQWKVWIGLSKLSIFFIEVHAKSKGLSKERKGALSSWKPPTNRKLAKWKITRGMPLNAVSSVFHSAENFKIKTRKIKTGVLSNAGGGCSLLIIDV